MAANSKGRAIAGVFGKRIANRIWANNPAPLPASSASCLRRVANFNSSYDKNVEDQVRPAVVPDYVIASESDKYWGPNPKTGVFGPADPHSATPGGGGARTAAAEPARRRRRRGMVHPHRCWTRLHGSAPWRTSRSPPVSSGPGCW